MRAVDRVANMGKKLDDRTSGQAFEDHVDRGWIKDRHLPDVAVA